MRVIGVEFDTTGFIPRGVNYNFATHATRHKRPTEKCQMIYGKCFRKRLGKDNKTQTEVLCHLHMHQTKHLCVALSIILLSFSSASSQMKQTTALSEKEASHFASLALKCVNRELPNKPEHVINSPTDVQSPKALHPAFYGCYDWHSSVHGHWMLIRLLKSFPNLPEASQIRSALGANLT